METLFSDSDPAIWHFHDFNPGDTNGGRALCASLCTSLGMHAVEINTEQQSEKTSLVSPFEFLLDKKCPSIAVCSNNRSGPAFLRAVKMQSPYTLTLQVGLMPVGCLRHFDFICYPGVEKYLPFKNAEKTLGVLSIVNPKRLSEESEKWNDEWRGCEENTIAVLVGGSTEYCHFDFDYLDHLIENLLAIEKKYPCSFLFLSNRRLSEEKWFFLRKHFQSSKHRFFYHADKAYLSANPYLAYIARAKAFIVTADSLSMISDACATGYDVQVLGLESALKGRWSGFYQELISDKLIRPFDGEVFLAREKRAPLLESDRIAALVKEKYPRYFHDPRKSLL